MMTQLQDIPKIGMGTFRLEGDVAYNSVKLALESGYRHIDTAQIYGNEAEVGQALADSSVKRNEVFITTKIWIDNLAKDNFIPSVEDSLQKLQVASVDLLLIHWPDVSGKVSMKTYLTELEKCKKLGLAREIGVSNFNNAQLSQAVEFLGENVIYTNQIEVHPFLQNQKVIEHCKAKNIRVTGYMPLAVGKVMEDATLQKIAIKHNVTVSEVAIAWQIQQGIATIPSSTKKINLDTNLKAVHLTLTNEDMHEIKTLDRNERIANPDFSPEWD